MANTECDSHHVQPQEIVSRSEAQARGLKRFFTGKPCKNAHLAERSVCDRSCVICSAEKVKRLRRAQGIPERVYPTKEQQKERRSAYNRAYALANPEKERAKDRRWKDANRDLMNARTREARAKPGSQRDQRIRKKASYRAENRDKISDYDRLRRETQPNLIREIVRRSYWKHVEKNRQRVKAYREKNLEREKTARAARKYWREWRARNLEHAREYARRYYAEKPNKTVAVHIRRARKKGADGTHTAEDLKAILKVQDHKCAYCRANLRKVKRHLDHIMPLVLGGSNDKANLQYLCVGCNLSKGAKDPIAFAQELGRLL